MLYPHAMGQVEQLDYLERAEIHTGFRPGLEQEVSISKQIRRYLVGPICLIGFLFAITQCEQILDIGL